MSRRNKNSSDNRNRSFGGNRSRPSNRGGYGGNRPGGGGGQRRPVELHKVICSKCKKETEVPFKPDGTRPVFCRDCYQQQKSNRY